MASVGQKYIYIYIIYMYMHTSMYVCTYVCMYHQVCQYLIVGIDKEMYGFPKVHPKHNRTIISLITPANRRFHRTFSLNSLTTKDIKFLPILTVEAKLLNYYITIHYMVLSAILTDLRPYGLTALCKIHQLQSYAHYFCSQY